MPTHYNSFFILKWKSTTPLELTHTTTNSPERLSLLDECNFLYRMLWHCTFCVLFHTANHSWKFHPIYTLGFAFHASRVGKWVPASAGKEKAGMVHSVSRWTRGVQVKLWDRLRTRAIPERLRCVIMTRHYTNPRLPLPLPSHYSLPNYFYM